MTATIIGIATLFAFACLALALAFATVRLVIGPGARDRVLAFDTMYIIGVMMVLLMALRSGTAVYFDVALLMALFGFVGSSALAKFLLRGEVIEP
ncbi:MAG: K+/H+ antiporter subunit F [Betaproteobacteria bacterium]|nr:MAG: K+/H+ antiporter subunit F [Betaproteobacteria bacterium]